MNEKDIVKEAIKSRGLNQVILSQMCGMKRPSNLSELLRSKSITVQNFVMLMDAMGFEVQVRDKNASNKDNRWTVTRDE